MHNKLETAANVATVLAAATMLTVVGWSQYRKAVPPPTPKATTYAPGEQIDGVPLKAFTGPEATVVLAISSKCAYCTASMPFYRSLAKAAGESRRPLRVIAVSRESSSTLDAYVKENSLPVWASYSEPRGFRKIRATPTLLLVDPTGVVKQAWVGQLSESEKAEVLKRLLPS